MAIALPEKYLERIYPEPNTGCWLWVGLNTPQGYGQIWFSKRKMRGAHVEVYERLKGKIPPGYEIDHLCRVPMCVNPDHLEAVSHKVNMQRGGLVTRKKRKFCKRGHEFTPENSIFKPDGRKQCYTCAEVARKARGSHATSASQTPHAIAARLNGLKAAEARKKQRLERIARLSDG